MIFKIPQTGGTATHDLTDWYVFPTDNVNDVANSIYSVTGDVTYKNAINIMIDIPVGTIYYLVAKLYFSDGTTLWTKPMPMTHYDMDGKTVHPLSFGVETPRLKVLSNQYAQGGDIVIESSKIRPVDNVFKNMYVVIEDVYGTVIHFDVVQSYQYTIQNSIFVYDVNDIIVKIAHEDSTGTLSEFDITSIHMKDYDITLINKNVLPVADFFPLFDGVYSAISEITIADKNGKIITTLYEPKVPANTLSFDSVYEMTVTFKVDQIYKSYTYNLITTPSKTVDYLPEYTYSEFVQTTEFNIPLLNNGYVETTASALMGFIDSQYLYIKYFNNLDFSGTIDITFSPTHPTETRNLAEDIVYIKTRTTNGVWLMVVNLTSKYNVPMVVSATELTNALSDECIMTTDNTIVYLENGNSGVNIVSKDMFTGATSIIHETIPQEYIVADAPLAGYEGLYDRQHSLLKFDNLLLVMDRNLGVYAFDMITHQFRFVFALEDIDKGKSFFMLRLHGNKIMCINTNSVAYIYDFDTDTYTKITFDSMDAVINVMAYDIIMKNTTNTMVYR